jgi:hypothetical protein
MKTIARHIAAVSGLILCLACGFQADRVRSSPPPTPIPTADERVTSWHTDPTADTDNEPLKRAWGKFERSQNYRLAQFSDRNLTPAAAARVKSNNPNQIKPSLIWWGARGYRGPERPDFLIAIVVDPSPSDPKRYGLVVIAAVTSDGGRYKPYWVSRDEDMESYLISPASGSVYVECFHRNGTEETKELVWDRSSRQFRLV